MQEEGELLFRDAVNCDRHDVRGRQARKRLLFLYVLEDKVFLHTTIISLQILTEKDAAGSGA
jgi:hypothetical protein